MIVYRLMCEEEASTICEKFPLSWNSKFKWFTDNLDFLSRVSDGQFNNGKSYEILVTYEIKHPNVLKRVSDNELMLARRDQPLAGISILSKERLCYN